MFWMMLFRLQGRKQFVILIKMMTLIIKVSYKNDQNNNSKNEKINEISDV